MGAGSIGARHVQAMARISVSAELDIVDPLQNARRHAISLLADAGGLRSGAVREYDHVNQLVDTPNLAIVATNSRERAETIRSLIDRGAQALILEKVLFTRLADYDAIDGILSAPGVQAWVNCPRGAYPKSTRLKELIGDESFHYTVEGQGWGLGCNLIHHLEEFSNLSHRSDIRLDGTALDMTVIRASRPGYVEFFGRMSGESLEGNSLTAICVDGPARARTVTIDLGKSRLTISPDQTLKIEQGGRCTTEAYPITPQSEMTATFVDAVLSGDAPSLPDYPTSSRLHRTMLSAFLEHLRRVRGDQTIDECPIT